MRRKRARNRCGCACVCSCVRVTEPVKAMRRKTSEAQMRVHDQTKKSRTAKPPHIAHTAQVIVSTAAKTPTEQVHARTTPHTAASSLARTRTRSRLRQWGSNTTPVWSITSVCGDEGACGDVVHARGRRKGYSRVGEQVCKESKKGRGLTGDVADGGEEGANGDEQDAGSRGQADDGEHVAEGEHEARCTNEHEQTADDRQVGAGALGSDDSASAHRGEAEEEEREREREMSVGKAIMGTRGGTLVKQSWSPPTIVMYK